MSDTTPHGYKMTEVGVIPEDWEIVALKSIGVFKKGRNIPKSSLTLHGLPCVLYGEIYTKYAEVVTKLESRISIETARNSVNIHNGDILLSVNGV